jgi:hypothetical protein
MDGFALSNDAYGYSPSYVCDLVADAYSNYTIFAKAVLRMADEAALNKLVNDKRSDKAAEALSEINA